MTSKKANKLLLIGSSNGNAHIRNYYELIKDHFDEVLIVTNVPIDYCEHKVVGFGLKDPLKLFGSIKAVKAIIAAYQPDIIHVHQSNVYGYVATKANQGKYPLVLTTWGSDVLILPNTNFFNKYIVKTALKGANYITADARFMGDKIQNLTGRTDTVIANFGIDISLSDENPPKENLIYSNRLHNELYNIDKVINGTGDFLRKNEDWKIIIGANGSKTEELKALAEKNLPNGSYSFPGFLSREENKSNYLRSHIYVSIPSSDGTAISLLEAMAYGCIPVVSDLPANREWIEDGINGIIVKNNDLTSALDKAKNLDQKVVAELNRKIIRERGSKENNRKLFIQIYENCLNA
ncbi:MAG: glycosyltransferase [Bacteroidetes bacterium]|nr:MAG: glycosyltransferase [Bacteroidota bacterium]